RVVSLSTTTIMERRAFQKTMEEGSILAELELDTNSDIVDDTDDDPDFSRFYCMDCNVALCVPDCFKEYHTKKDFV
ncbi:hypothetical protein J6590_067983, partial [Homalodisca vitripennis]